MPDDKNTPPKNERLQRKIKQMLTKKNNFTTSFMNQKSSSDAISNASPDDRKKVAKEILAELNTLASTILHLQQELTKIDKSNVNAEIGVYLLDRALNLFNEYIQNTGINNFDNNIELLAETIFNIHYVLLDEGNAIIKELNVNTMQKLNSGFSKNAKLAEVYASMLPNQKQRANMEVVNIACKSIAEKLAPDNTLRNS